MIARTWHGVARTEDADAIRAFAGDGTERARYYSGDRRYLLEPEPHVTHYEVLEHP